MNASYQDTYSIPTDTNATTHADFHIFYDKNKPLVIILSPPCPSSNPFVPETLLYPSTSRDDRVAMLQARSTSRGIPPSRYRPMRAIKTTTNPTETAPRASLLFYVFCLRGTGINKAIEHPLAP